jgi:hypothetical protein
MVALPLQDTLSQLSVIGGQEFYRLKQELQSGGDIFEIDSSVKALALGPQSDVADLLVTFFDAQSNVQIGQTIISAKVPFIGRVDARLATEIPSAGTVGRIQVSVRDLVPSWPTTGVLPSGVIRAAGATDFVAANIKPVIDLLAYLSNPPALPPARSGRSYFFPFIATGAGAAAWYLLPYYGRTYGHLNFVNVHQAAAIAYTVNVYGISLSAGTDFTSGITKQGETLLGTLTVNQDETGNLIWGLCEGMYDYIAVQVASSGLFDPDTTMRVTVMDE